MKRSTLRFAACQATTITSRLEQANMDVVTPRDDGGKVIQTPRNDMLYAVAIDDCEDGVTGISVEDAQPAAKWSMKRKAVVAAAAALVLVGALVAALMYTHAPNDTTDASFGTGNDISVCYDSYNDINIATHFRTIRQRFTGIRTYQTRGYRNAIDVAAEAGLKIYAGVWIRTDEASINADMQAVVDGVRRNPSVVKGVFVGNEELHVGIDQWTVLGRVRQMRQRLQAAGFGWVPVGSVQVDGNWGGASALANECDLIGVNIHPFFSAASVSTWNPLEDLKTRWNAMYKAYGNRAVLTETGWPTSGSQYYGHWPNFDTAKNYYFQVLEWSKGNGGNMPSHFMFHDNTLKPTDFEKSFGLAWSNGAWKWDAPAAEIKGVVFVNKANDKVLAAAPNRAVEFHARWGNDWVWDWASQWTIRGPLVVTWDAANKVDLCLDAYQPWNGGAVHLWPCDANNGNQKWAYDGNTKQLRHATHNGFCLDMANPAGGTPHLWSCHDPWVSWVTLQQFEWWTR
ncbi:hypothetical protein H310_00645 [Aphanomyces invadans]|uniref:glucan endo-1,3-beta-D-glucosidase n=1 Tax=Aphanomyces invadans TaxID=157072 RepID=A0A024UWG2_9STRA|nr:hypothetical protein H310_00645 [Aphanomyces invadans]ETW10305.1 hypothetical protein H310_00645 [Aphanomyces invadans]|eukprot:XP_008861716.1 hypothetical protein H310_00645 [Aphanomyces invadans]